MAWLNEAVLNSNPHLFCTACYATLTLDDEGWQLTSTAAGHPLPIIAHPAGPETLGRPGTLLGAFDEITTTTGHARLEPGDVLLLYADGITDVPLPHALEPAELSQFIHRSRHLRSADEIAEAIQRSLLARIPDRGRQDDVALLVVRAR